ncbi:protein SEH1-like [Helianthus annuus]|uniref:protein SEH1-like n=1 Tax=Helianthus annuus TaxID=4232 RepID=UPI001652D587|nr:protein SEH1-like [Helianthus annuus]
MEKSIATLDKGTICSSWNYCAQRLATGLIDGTIAIFDTNDPASSFFTSTFKFKVNNGSITKVVWVPPEYGDAIACICSDGSLSIWEEISEDSEPVQWKQCTSFGGPLDQVLDGQFGNSVSSLKLTIAYSNGLVKVYEILNSMELKNWQLQVLKLYNRHMMFHLDLILRWSIETSGESSCSIDIKVRSSPVAVDQYLKTNLRVVVVFRWRTNLRMKKQREK